MLIIFDLDDTLIDTSGCITPVKLEYALTKMVDEGLTLPSYDVSLEVLKRLNLLAQSGGHALSEFAELYDIGSHFLDIGLKELYENFYPEIPVFPTDQAPSVLCELKNAHQLAVVTIGKPLHQYEKMKKAGIDSTIFSKIVVIEEKNKKSYYQSIVEELGFAVSDVVVCGDKISVDLSPAKELGFKTIHMRYGRGKNSLGLKEDVDHTISRLSEIIDILEMR